jgi:hypothetical protein
LAGLFVFSTGQLEAWWAFWDEQACKPVEIQNVTWKFPGCDANFPGENSTEMAVEEFDPAIMADNSTCW